MFSFNDELIFGSTFGRGHDPHDPPLGSATDLDADSGSEIEDFVEEMKSLGNFSSSSDEEETSEEDNEEGEQISNNQYKCRSGMIWCSTVPPRSKTKQANIVKEVAGPKSTVGNKIDPVDIFNMFLTLQMLSDVLRFTNAEGRRRAEAMQPPRTDWKPITNEELLEHLDIVMYSGQESYCY